MKTNPDNPMSADTFYAIDEKFLSENNITLDEYKKVLESISDISESKIVPSGIKKQSEPRVEPKKSPPQRKVIKPKTLSDPYADIFEDLK